MVKIDMDIPKSCGECNFVFNEEGYVQLCRINDEVVEDYYFDKNPNCPLIEIVEGEVK